MSQTTESTTSLHKTGNKRERSELAKLVTKLASLKKRREGLLQPPQAKIEAIDDEIAEVKALIAEELENG